MYILRPRAVPFVRAAAVRPRAAIPSRHASEGSHLSWSHFMNTGIHLLSRDGEKEWKRLHKNGVLYTPAMSSVPRTFMVYHELRANPELAGFDPVEFLGGAAAALPVVHRLMHDMDLDSAAASSPKGAGDKGATAPPAASAGSPHFPGSKRDNTVRLKELVSARLFTAVRESMALAASLSQSWRVEEVTVKRAWIHAIGTFTEDAAALAAAGSPPPRTVVRVAVGFEAFESYAVELADAPAPVVQARDAAHTWTFERAVDAQDGADPTDFLAVAEAGAAAATKKINKEGSGAGAAAAAAAAKDPLSAQRRAAVEALGATYAAAVRAQDQASRDAHALLEGDLPEAAPTETAAKKKQPSFEVVAVAVDKPMGLTLAEEIEERSDTEDELEEAKIDQEVEQHLADMAEESGECVDCPAGQCSSPRRGRRRASVAVVQGVAAGSRADGCLVSVGDRLVSVDGVAVASFEAAMAALRTAPSPVPLVFHRATRAHAEASVVAEAGPTAAAAAETAEEERATAEEAEARPDSNWRIVNIG